jgi:hypothetical protein
VLFSLRTVKAVAPNADGTGDVCYPQYLDITVTNRSNDTIWGLLGTNYQTFSILQEYMAARLGVEVGRYTHFTNNLHCYVERKDWDPEAWLECESGEAQRRYHPDLHMVPLIRDPAVFEQELPRFVGAHSSGRALDLPAVQWREPFLADVAEPMLTAFHYCEKKCYNTARLSVSEIKADDWRIAATNWLRRRADPAAT